jgi:dCTP deaminase
MSWTRSWTRSRASPRVDIVVRVGYEPNMILTGPAIEGEWAAKRIIIHPFRPEQCGPNSYDVRLAYITDRYGVAIDPDKNLCHTLKPGKLYLGATVETVGCPAYSDVGYVPIMHGRSSLARLGVSVHVCAGFGDDGFVGVWTLEITAVEKVKIKLIDERVAQIAFHPTGGSRRPYVGKYQGAAGVGTSLYEGL